MTDTLSKYKVDEALCNYPELEHVIYIRGFDNIKKIVAPYANTCDLKAIVAQSFRLQKQSKEPQPYGWYRKFEKKRF